MKRWIALLLTAVLCLSLVACGSSATEETSESSAAETEESEETEAVEETPAEETEPEEETSAEESEEETPDAETEPAEETPSAEPEEDTPVEETEPAQEATMIQIGDTIENDNFVMSFNSMEILPEFSYEIDEYSSRSLYVEDGYELLLVQGHIENKSMSVISDSSFFKSVVVNGAYNADDVSLDFKRSKYFEIDPYTDLDFYLYIDIPEKLAAQFETAEFTIAFNDDLSLPVTYVDSDGTESTPMDNTYILTGGIAGSGETADATVEAETAAAASAYKTISLGDTIETEEFDFTLNNVEIINELKPSNTSSVYTSYEAEDGEVYVHVDGSYYNKSKEDICIRDLFTPTVDYDNGYVYNGFVITDKGDNSFTWVSSYVVCTPLSTCHYHGLISCPQVIESSDASLIVTMEIGGETYQYTLR